MLTCFLSVSSVQHEINEGHKTKAVFQESFKMRPSSGAGTLYAYIGKLGSHLGWPYSKGNKKKIQKFNKTYLFLEIHVELLLVYTQMIINQSLSSKQSWCINNF